jgi:hypothetical protein
MGAVASEKKKKKKENQSEGCIFCLKGERRHAD